MCGVHSKLDSFTSRDQMFCLRWFNLAFSYILLGGEGRAIAVKVSTWRQYENVVQSAGGTSAWLSMRNTYPRNQCAFGFGSWLFWRCATRLTSYRAGSALQSLARKSRSNSKAETCLCCAILTGLQMRSIGWFNVALQSLAWTGHCWSQKCKIGLCA